MRSLRNSCDQTCPALLCSEKQKKEHVGEILNETLGAAYTQHLTSPSPWTLTQCPYRNTYNAIILIKVGLHHIHVLFSAQYTVCLLL